LEQDYDKSEEDIKALQSVGQIIGEVLKALDDERCERRHPFFPFRDWVLTQYLFPS
jgi:ATP-dependent 26S proteasome regulatory subunit